MILFFFNDTATTEIYTLSLHDALPICLATCSSPSRTWRGTWASRPSWWTRTPGLRAWPPGSPRRRRSCRATRSCCSRSEEHTSELQSRQYLVCRLLLEKKKIHYKTQII